MTMTFIDIHVHTRRGPGPLRADGTTYATPEQLIAQYDRLGIEQAVILPGAIPDGAHLVQSNEEALDIARDFPGRFIPFCNIDPRMLTNSADAPLENLLGWYKDRGCRGVGELTANLPFSDGRVQNLFRAAEAVGLPLTFHIAHELGGCYGLYDDPGLPQLEESLRRFSRLTFLGHSQPFWAEIGRLRQADDRRGYPDYPVEGEGAVPRLMRRCPNLYGDLSAYSGYNALARDRDYAARFMEEFQDRLLFGTDICRPDQEVPQVALLLELRDTGRISPTVFDKIARQNARRLLGV